MCDVIIQHLDHIIASSTVMGAICWSSQESQGESSSNTCTGSGSAGPRDCRYAVLSATYQTNIARTHGVNMLNGMIKAGSCITEPAIMPAIQHASRIRLVIIRQYLVGGLYIILSLCQIHFFLHIVQRPTPIPLIIYFWICVRVYISDVYQVTYSWC